MSNPQPHYTPKMALTYNNVNGSAYTAESGLRFCIVEHIDQQPALNAIAMRECACCRMLGITGTVALEAHYFNNTSFYPGSPPFMYCSNCFEFAPACNHEQARQLCGHCGIEAPLTLDIVGVRSCAPCKIFREK